MKAWLASVEEVFREASARWTLLAYFALSSLFILTFAGQIEVYAGDSSTADLTKSFTVQ